MKQLIPLLKVTDLDATLRFYVEVLGFEVCWREDETAQIHSGQVGLMFSTGSNLGREPTLSGTLYFYPADIAAVWDAVRDRIAVE